MKRKMDSYWQQTELSRSGSDEWLASQTPGAMPTDLMAVLAAGRAQVQADTIALRDTDSDSDVSYASLWGDAARLAHLLRRRGIGTEDVIALLFNGPAPLPGCVIGTLAAGAAFLPLDPTAPNARLATLLEEAHPALIITDVASLERLPTGQASLVIDADDTRTALEAEPSILPQIDLRPEPVSYTHLRAHETRGNLVCRLLL